MMGEGSVNHILYIDDDKGMLRTVSKWQTTESWKNHA